MMDAPRILGFWVPPTSLSFLNLSVSHWQVLGLPSPQSNLRCSHSLLLGACVRINYQYIPETGEVMAVGECVVGYISWKEPAEVAGEPHTLS